MLSQRWNKAALLDRLDSCCDNQFSDAAYKEAVGLAYLRAEADVPLPPPDFGDADPLVDDDSARSRKLDGQTAGRLLDQLAAKAKCDPDTALSYILGTLSDKKLDQILPKKYSKARAQATANELVKYKTHTHSTRYIGILTGNTLNRHINERLSLARCLNIKTRNMLSRRLLYEGLKAQSCEEVG